MKKSIIKKNIWGIMGLILCGSICLSSCKKHVDDFDFTGTVIGVRDCSSMSMSISELDWGYIVEVSSPEGIGAEYYDNDGKKHTNVVILYGTKTRLSDQEKLSGRMYMDENYSRSYCNYHYSDGVPEAVCSELD